VAVELQNEGPLIPDTGSEGSDRRCEGNQYITRQLNKKVSPLGGW